MRVAAVQLSSGNDLDRNLDEAAERVAEGAGRGAELVVLPEMFNRLGSGRVLRDGAEPAGGPTTAWAVEQARTHAVWLVAGTFIERHTQEPEPRRTNTAMLVSPAGEITARYDKIHLFDCDVPGAEFHESAVTSPGGEIVVAPAGPVTVGFSVCYDLRFPELFRVLALAGAEVVVVPAAFTARTGPPHWEVLLRARAIENQVYVVAAGQVGDTVTPDGDETSVLSWHGHSMIVDPWGRIVAEATEPAPGVIVGDIDLQELRQVRQVLPSLTARRPATYTWSGGGLSADPGAPR